MFATLSLKALKTFCCASDFIHLPCNHPYQSSFEGRNVKRRSASTISSKVIPEKEDKSFIDVDVEKLCSHVLINYFIEGDEPGPKILPDSEYPSWLFKLNVRRCPELEDLDMEKDGWLYWRKLRTRQIEQMIRFNQLKYRYFCLQRSPSRNFIDK